ncbi:hypothetical protein F5B21DRAFT_481704 [Xylaria acuta]|nr:hypothetical protein F5B21DRAFT_481704 [Xylaria acuta]
MGLWEFLIFFYHSFLFHLAALALVVGVWRSGVLAGCLWVFGVRRLGDLAFSGVGGCFYGVRRWFSGHLQAFWLGGGVPAFRRSACFPVLRFLVPR